MFGWLRALLLGPGWQVARQAEAQPTGALPLPIEVTLGGEAVTLRLMSTGDGPAVLAFARALPPHDLLFLRRDITDQAQVSEWLDEVARGQTTTILAAHDGAIVGYATVAWDGLAWTRHVRELRVMVAEAFRAKRLGRLLVEQAFAVATAQGVKKMIAQMTTDQVAAIRVFTSLGFVAEARLRNQVIDRDGGYHDLQIMGLDVDAFQAKLDSALALSQDPFVGV